jgi:hypothetical protein
LNEVSTPAAHKTIGAVCLDFIRDNNKPIVFGLALTGDILWTIYGGVAKNWCFDYSGKAAIACTAIMTVPGLLKPRIGADKVKRLENKAIYIAGPLHHTLGLATIASGFGLGGTGVSGSEIVIGALVLGAGINQFWGEKIQNALPDKPALRFIKSLNPNKIASYMNLAALPFIFLDALRVHSPYLLSAVSLYVVSSLCLRLAPLNNQISPLPHQKSTLQPPIP